MPHGNHHLDEITRLRALLAIDTARRITRGRVFDTVALKAAMDALDTAVEAIRQTAPIHKAGRLKRLRASITAWLTSDDDGSEYATSVQSRGGI